MGSETVTALAVRKEETIEVVDAKPCPDVLALMADAKEAEKLVPWTDEEISKATVAEIGERVRLVCAHFKLALMSEHDFVMRFRKEFLALREKSRQQGRRLPIPGCADWTELKKQYFRMSSRQIDRLLEDPNKTRAKRKPKPKGEQSNYEEPEVVEPDQPLPVTDAAVARIHKAVAEVMAAEAESQSAESEDTIDEDEDTLSAMSGCWRDLFADKPKPERPAAIHSFFISLGDEYRDDIIAAANMLVLPAQKQIEHQVDVLEHAIGMIEGKRDADGADSPPAVAVDPGSIHGETPRAGDPEWMEAYRLRKEKREAKKAARRAKALADLGSVSGKRKKAIDLIMRCVEADKKELFEVGTFRKRDEFLRGLTDNFLWETLNLLKRAGKLKMHGDKSHSNWVHGESRRFD